MTPASDLASHLALLEVRTPDDEPVRLGSFWEKRPAVLVFIRHFG